MTTIEQQLVADGIEIPSRPIFAMMEVSKQFKIQLRGGPRTAHSTAQEIKEIAYADAISEWYERNYNARLNESPGPLRTALLVDGDLYSLRIPWQLGSVAYVSTREWLPSPCISRGPVKANVVQFLDDITPARAKRLSDRALRDIAEAFAIAYPAASTLTSSSHKLISIARGDAQAAVTNLMAMEQRYGESRWASLQAAEKTIKAAIELTGAKFEQTHNLQKLYDQLTAAGIKFDARSLIYNLQCWPSIRYGEDPSTREQALLAHRSSLELVNSIRETGVPL
ncbi:HEPN domain-containing protein [Qipengyuania sp. S6317L1]|uniref:HEPN domain-containing protein n=1 Tax=Qipengyuania sp. S6317L1 TaxID=2926410 RepID=UPI001FF33C4E|nr:HEPN domain-containing protein [Qipengyuania sp. S6317L1]MCK0098075.1 HEPN domain-containing protein [Qipengyuania sp. S6317L1]